MEDYDVIDNNVNSSIDRKITLECINEFTKVKNDSEKKELTTMIHIKAPKLESTEERKKNLRISAVIDVSGSMNGEKIELVKESLSFMVQELGENDEFGIVTFESNVKIELPIKKMDKENKEFALYKIKEIETGDCTNLSGGLFAGIDQIRTNNSNDTTNAVLLFTDGQANFGIVENKQLFSSLNMLIGNMNDHVIYTFGFGETHNSELLKKIAEKGNGTYSFIQNTSAMKEILVNCLGGLMSVVAQNLKLIVTPKEDIELVKIRTKFPMEKEGNSSVVLIKDLFSEESRDLLVILKTNKFKENDNEELSLVTYTLNYENIITGKTDTLTQTASIKLSNDECDEKPNLILDEQRNRMDMLDELEKANRYAETGNLDAANLNINNLKAKLKNTVSANTNYTNVILNDLDYVQNAFTDVYAYNTKGSKMFADKFSAHMIQRNNAALEQFLEYNGSDGESDGMINDNNLLNKKSRTLGCNLYCNSYQMNMQKKCRK